MYEVGDLVIVNKDCAIKNYRGKLAVVVKSVGQDPIDLAGGYYFKIQFASGRQEILTNKEISMLSKAK